MQTVPIFWSWRELALTITILQVVSEIEQQALRNLRDTISRVLDVDDEEAHRLLAPVIEWAQEEAFIDKKTKTPARDLVRYLERHDATKIINDFQRQQSEGFE